jgi:hypothetical protein
LPVYQRSGFIRVAGITTLALLLTLLLVIPLHAVTPSCQGRVKMLSVVWSIWLPGLGAALVIPALGVEAVRRAPRQAVAWL